MMDERLLAFLGVAVLVTITPGPDMALLTRYALVNGRRAALQAMAGVMTGLLAWAALSVAGLAALLTASATAFTVLKIVGGAYLVFLGVQTLWQSRSGRGEATPEFPATAAGRATGRQAYRQGLLSNLLNPKVGVFYTSFLPQFVSVDGPALPQLAGLALLHFLIGIVWLTCFIQMVVKAGGVLRRPSVRRWVDRATGVVLVALGLRLATERR